MDRQYTIVLNTGLVIKTDYPEKIIQKQNGWVTIIDPKAVMSYRNVTKPFIMRTGRKAVRLLP